MLWPTLVIWTVVVSGCPSIGEAGDYDSVIGMEKEASQNRWRSDLPSKKLEPAMGEATLCGLLLTTDDQNGLARSIEPIRVGGRLSPVMPALS